MQSRRCGRFRPTPVNPEALLFNSARPLLLPDPSFMNAALLIIDVQQGLCEGDHAAYAFADVITNINVVSAKARAAIGVSF